MHQTNFPLSDDDAILREMLLARKQEAREACAQAIKHLAPLEFKELFGFDMNRPFFFKDGKKPYTAVFEVDSNLVGQWRKVSETGANTPLSPFDYKHVKPC